MMVKRLFGLLTLMLMLNLAVAREWTSSDGRKLTADFVSLSGDQVTLKRSDSGQTIALPLSRLSEADQQWIKEQPAPGAKTAAVEGEWGKLFTGEWALAEHKGLPFAFWGPKEVVAGKTYPLVLSLHGRSDNNENGKQVGDWTKSFTKPERFEKNPCFVLAPLCYQPYGGTGGGWSDQPGTQAVALVKELTKSLPIDKTRVYCIGYSMGGFGTCHLINRESRLFAAGIAVAGCTGPETAGAFRKVPLWLHHAVDDATVKVELSRNLAEALKRVKECKYTEYPSGGHGIGGQVFANDEVHAWLFSHGGK